MSFMNGKMGRSISMAALSVGLLGATGCDGDSPLGDIVGQCGLGCEKGAFEAGGSAALTGLADIDGFFQAVLDFEGAGKSVTRDIDLELNGIKSDFGIGAKADFKAEFDAKANAYLEGGISIDIQEPKCAVDAQVSIDAAAQCDVDVDPGMVSVECKGSCEADVSAEVMCEGSIPSCSFKGPSVACEGSCQGTCKAELEVAAECEGSCEGSCKVEAGVEGGCSGSCSGSCEGSCTVEMNAGATCDGVCDGECSGSTDAGGVCDGECKGSCTAELSGGASCNGTCEGTCDVECDIDASAGVECSGKCEGSCNVEAEAGIECSGTCEGSCEVSGPDVDCSGAVEAKCEAMADAMVSCSGKCDGEVEPPSVKAECEAQVSAQAEMSVECTPPGIDISYELKAGLDADAQLEADAFVEGIINLKTRLPRLKAAFARAERIQGAGENLGTAGKAAIQGAVDGVGSGDIVLVAKLGCAGANLKGAADKITDTAGDLAGSATASAEVFGAFGI